MLRPNIPEGITFNERIIDYGFSGTGKSFDLYTIPRLSIRTGSDAIFYIIDTDESAGRMLSDPTFSDLIVNGKLANIRVLPVYQWEELITTLEKIQGVFDSANRWVPGSGVLRPQDWLCIDMLTPSWQWVQDWYTRNFYGKDLQAYFTEAKQKRAPGTKPGTHAFSQDKENHWTYINTEYGKLATRLLRSPGNLFCTASQKKFDAEKADKADRAAYGTIGFIPDGQKSTTHHVHSTFHKAMGYKGEYQITSAKNRSRSKLESVELRDDAATDFAMKVLVNNQGWML